MTIVIYDLSHNSYSFEFMNEREIKEYDDRARKLCAKIAAIREAKGISKNKIAELSGLSWAAVMRIEKGERIPSISTLMRLAAVLEIDLADLVREFSNK